MHIPQPKLQANAQQELRADLLKLIEQPSASQVPPCPNCTQALEQRDDCSYNCENAASALSVEPTKFPIEQFAMPLVFELTTLRLVQTCWSCEGHANFEGEILKMPRISFYAVRPIYAQLIGQYLTQLYFQKKLHYPWEVALSDYGQTLEITYTIKCDTSFEKPDLKLMQEDLLNMANNLSTEVKSFAHRMLTKLNNVA